MTITIRPIHVAVALAFIAGIAVAIGVVLASSGGDDSAATNQEVPSTANLDTAASPAPTATSPAAEPTPEPSATPSPEPTQPPAIRSCAEIRADPTYRSPDERSFFLDNCLDGATTAPAANSNEPSPASSSSGDATADEKRYRERAEGSVNVFAIRIAQFVNSPSAGATGDVLEFGAVMRRFAQELDILPTPPPRFKQAHDQLRAALIALADYTTTIGNLDLENEAAVLAWLNGYFEFAASMIEALDDYAVVLGINLPADLADDP